MNDTQINQAYRDYMKNLASALTNDTSMIGHDIIDMYEFEKTIAQVHRFPVYTPSKESFPSSISGQQHSSMGQIIIAQLMVTFHLR